MQRTKNSVTDTFKPYLATIILMVLDSSVGVFELIISLDIPEMYAFLFVLAHAVDIIVLALSERDIRKQLKHTFLCLLC